ncbi:eukaryotic translation initiation factor 2-alpha kinase 3-like [Gigantopelta aegis]|uniref:eukaryotic translation initiation factor 2-alpha kinase 3-like n=1 Tax=Gigantopelta aegis TaxID=1735272 RepID=UPI001B88BDC7|nr:eukaryotic translation initiation factor 2-alpha kinase 3-like [Gigantopelta aegis]
MGRMRTRRWFSRVVGVIASLAALGVALVNGSTETTSDGIEKPQSTPGPNSPKPACQKTQGQLREKFLMLVSTIDGKVSALDVRNQGELVWSLQADIRPLLSSSIDQMEVTRDGVRTRLIPSLDGGLYQYDGDSIEAVPLTAETLLASSMRLSDNTMMIGGKDIRTYGIDANSGQVRYFCAMAGCHLVDDSEVTTEEDILVLTRSTQTVRAVDARMGTEKWNFSVGRHEMELLDGGKPELTNKSDDDDGITITACSPSGEEITAENNNDLENFLKIIVPEGMVVALSADDSSDVLWQHKFSSPVANAWLLQYGVLKTVNLFDSHHVPALSSFQPENKEGIRPDPLLYVGMHQSQMYVQQSQHMREKVEESLKNSGQDVASRAMPRVMWRPYLNTAPSRTPIMKNVPGKIPLLDVQSTKGEKKKVETSIAVWHENYPFDNGYYLYPDITPWPEFEQLPNESGAVPPGMMDMVLPVSLWNWWKEVILISVITSIVVHVLLTKYQRREQSENSSSRQDSSGLNKSDSLLPTVDSSANLPDMQKTNEYISRFLMDFELLHCLGKGGFGIVFEARNRVDDQCYAVKRICIPNSEGSKERVLREVKALAKLDHVGIVRFFHAWVEIPPPGWQEEQDRNYVYSDCLSQCLSGTDMSSISKLPPNQAMEPCLEPHPANKQDDFVGNNNNNLSDLMGNKNNLNLYNRLCQGESSSFSPHSNDDDFTDESGSYSFVGAEPQKTYELKNDNANCDSFSIEFRNSDTESNNNDTDPFEENCVPFASYKKVPRDSTAERTDSFSIVFEDSGCKDRSSSGVTSTSTEHHSTQVGSRVQSSCDKEGESHEKISPSAPPDKQTTVSSVPKLKLYLYIQMQLCKRETLKDWLSANTLNRNRPVILDIFTQIVCAVDYVHGQGLMHRDLKPNNIFFSADDTIKVGDFGLVTPLAEQVAYTSTDVMESTARHTADVGTQLYMSPEQISKKPYDHKVDIFSLGMILFELLYPFSTQMERVRTLMNSKQQTFPERFEREMPTECKFVKWLLSPTPSDRPSAKQILDHQLLKEFVPKKTENRFRTLSDGSNSST